MELGIAELFRHLWEHLVLKLDEEFKQAWAHFVNWGTEHNANVHDVATGSESSVVPKLFVIVLFLKAIFESDSALLAILKLSVDAHSKYGWTGQLQLSDALTYLGWGMSDSGLFFINMLGT